MFVQTWSKTVALELVMRVGLLGSNCRSVLLCKESTCGVLIIQGGHKVMHQC